MTPNPTCFFHFHIVRTLSNFLLGKSALTGQPENPLLLLGQYSDDESDAQSLKGVDNAGVESSLDNNNDEVKESLSEDCKATNNPAVEECTAQAIERLNEKKNSDSLDPNQIFNGNDVGNIDVIVSDGMCKYMDSTDCTEKVSLPRTYYMVCTGDSYLGWKMVLHEDSNQYYYWNTETGETSWDVPRVLAQSAELTFEQKSLFVTQGPETVSLGIRESSLNLPEVDASDSSAMLNINVSESANFISEAKELNVGNRECESLDNKSCNDEFNQREFKNDTCFQNTGEVLVNVDLEGIQSDNLVHEKMADEKNGADTDISSSLIKNCECLLDKLKLVKRSICHLQNQDHDLVLKYMLEIEVRLTDVKALSPCGASLLPFWKYSERRLKQLEADFNEEIPWFVNKINLTETANNSIFKIGDKQEEIANHGQENAVLFSEHSVGSRNITTSSVIEKDLHNDAPSTDTSNAKQHGDTDEFVPKWGFNAGQDMDMDVEMEVEDDSIPANTTIAEDSFHSVHFTPSQEFSLQPTLTMETEDGEFVPLPPDDEWIPPPPCDSELVPSPPPNEPSYLETLQPLSYTEPYAFSYPNSNMDYYGQTVSEIPSSNFYGQFEGQNVSIPHQSLYYDLVAATYPNVTQTVVHPTGSLPPVLPVVSSVESSAFHYLNGSQCYGTLPTNQIGSLDVISDLTVTDDLSNVASIDLPTVSTTTVTSIDLPIISITNLRSLDLPDSSTNVVTTSTTTIAGVLSTSKTGTKASRVKRRAVTVAPSLRSNKKVSKLVDKWKAAKEELHEDDEEEESQNAYEFLEKKRQREIEQWHAQQISSGEAIENANFQPLCGNWRERVKRRRAARGVQSPSEAVNEKQMPNLTEIIKDLPRGWQAYWDESSKQVYYGNPVTSETSWSKPTK